MQNQIMNYDDYDENYQNFQKIPKTKPKNGGDIKGKKKRKPYDRQRSSDKFGTNWD